MRVAKANKTKFVPGELPPNGLRATGRDVYDYIAKHAKVIDVVPDDNRKVDNGITIEKAKRKKRITYSELEILAKKYSHKPLTVEEIHNMPPSEREKFSLDPKLSPRGDGQGNFPIYSQPPARSKANVIAGGMPTLEINDELNQNVLSTLGISTDERFTSKYASRSLVERQMDHYLREFAERGKQKVWLRVRGRYGDHPEYYRLTEHLIPLEFPQLALMATQIHFKPTKEELEQRKGKPATSRIVMDPRFPVRFIYQEHNVERGVPATSIAARVPYFGENKKSHKVVMGEKYTRITGYPSLHVGSRVNHLLRYDGKWSTQLDIMNAVSMGGKSSHGLDALVDLLNRSSGGFKPELAQKKVKKIIEEHGAKFSQKLKSMLASLAENYTPKRALKAKELAEEELGKKIDGTDLQHLVGEYSKSIGDDILIANPDYVIQPESHMYLSLRGLKSKEHIKRIFGKGRLIENVPYIRNKAGKLVPTLDGDKAAWSGNIRTLIPREEFEGVSKKAYANMDGIDTVNLFLMTRNDSLPPIMRTDNIDLWLTHFLLGETKTTSAEVGAKEGLFKNEPLNDPFIGPGRMGARLQAMRRYLQDLKAKGVKLNLYVTNNSQVYDKEHDVTLPISRKVMVDAKRGGGKWKHVDELGMEVMTSSKLFPELGDYMPWKVRGKQKFKEDIDGLTRKRIDFIADTMNKNGFYDDKLTLDGKTPVVDLLSDLEKNTIKIAEEATGRRLNRQTVRKGRYNEFSEELPWDEVIESATAPGKKKHAKERRRYKFRPVK